MEGIVYDKPAKGFRAVLGTLGSASLGGILSGPYEFGTIAPHFKHGIGWLDGRLTSLSGLGTRSSRVVEISADRSLPKPESAAWSADGSVAVLYSREGNWILPVSGLLDSPSVDGLIDVATSGGSLTAVAVDRNGEHVIIAITGESAGLYEVLGDGRFVKIADLARPVALCFSPDGQMLYAIDASAMQITELNISTRVVQSWALDAIGEPLALHATPGFQGRSLLLVAGRSDLLVVSYHGLDRQTVSRLELPFVASSLQQLGLQSVLLRAREDDGDPLWCLSTDSAPVVRFIPATPLALLEESGQ